MSQANQTSEQPSGPDGSLELACTADLLRYECERNAYLLANQGDLTRFSSEHGRLLASHPHLIQPMRTYLEHPAYFAELAITPENRDLLSEFKTPAKLDLYAPVEEFNESMVTQARNYVGSMLQIDLDSVRVVVTKRTVMDSEAQGVVYPNGTLEHLIVMPPRCRDPLGLLVRHFAISAHYSAMRAKGGLATLVTDTVAQEFIAVLVATRFALDEQSPELALYKQVMLLNWEYAHGLELAGGQPLAFIASRLGESLVKQFGPNYCEGMLQGLRASMPRGRGIQYGAHCFLGHAMALGLIREIEGLCWFIRMDRGDCSLANKLGLAFADINHSERILGFNENLRIALTL